MTRMGDTIVLVTEPDFEMTLVSWLENDRAVSYRYIDGYYTFHALPGMKFIIIQYAVKNLGSDDRFPPYLGELISETYEDSDGKESFRVLASHKGVSLTTADGREHELWSPAEGINTQEHSPRPSTDLEITSIGGVFGSPEVGFGLISPGRSTWGSMVFHIPAHIAPTRVNVVDLPLPISLSTEPLRVDVPIPTATPRALLTEAEVEDLVSLAINKCKISIDKAYGALTVVDYETRYLGEDRWLVEARWAAAPMTYGRWGVNSKTGEVDPFDVISEGVVSLMAGTGCGLPNNISSVALGTPEWWEAVAPFEDYVSSAFVVGGGGLELDTQVLYQLQAAIFVALEGLRGSDPNRAQFRSSILVIWVRVFDSYEPGYTMASLGRYAQDLFDEISLEASRYSARDPDTAWLKPYAAPTSEGEVSLSYWLLLAPCLGGLTEIDPDRCLDTSLSDFWSQYEAWVLSQR